MKSRENMFRYCILQNHISQNSFKELRTYILMTEAFGYKSKQDLIKINDDLNLIKNEVMNTLTDNIPYIENCVMTTYVRNGKLFVEITDGRTVDIMRNG